MKKAKETTDRRSALDQWRDLPHEEQDLLLLREALENPPMDIDGIDPDVVQARLNEVRAKIAALPQKKAKIEGSLPAEFVRKLGRFMTFAPHEPEDTRAERQAQILLGLEQGKLSFDQLSKQGLVNLDIQMGDGEKLAKGSEAAMDYFSALAEIAEQNPSLALAILKAIASSIMDRSSKL